MNLIRIEQETIIFFNEGENEAEVYTHNAKLKKKLKVAMEKHSNLLLKVSNCIKRKIPTRSIFRMI